MSDREAVHTLIGAVARRRWWNHLALVILAATIVASATGLLSSAARLPGLSRTTRMALALLVTAAGGAWAHRFRSRTAAALAIERASPACRNLVITAEELERHPERASSRMRARVGEDASSAVRALAPGDVVPLRATAAALLGSVAVSLLSLPAARESVRDAVQRLSEVLPSAIDSPTIHVTVDPPAYTGRPAAVLTDPQRIEVLEATRIRFDVPAGWRVRFGDLPVTSGHVARASGYFAVEPSSGHERRLIPLNVMPDHAPAVRISAPAKDLLLPDASRTIPISVGATDDLALRILELRYTRVSGSGEQFEFIEGTLPVRVEKRSSREWTADAQLALASLELAAGDSLVYRAVARDGRPGNAGVASSDTYFVEIAGPGQASLGGLEMPPEMDRHAMSQQMIVLKLERLRKREAGMTRAELAEESASLAAEQRTVRANFIFLLGGHVEDEEEEAARSHEIQEGRLENSARKDINAAISEMTRAEQGMTAVDLAAALPPARAAVESLQRAFGRSRYLLRALAARSRLDPSRRLTGDVAGAGDWRRTRAEADARQGQRVRELLSGLIDAVPRNTGPGTPDKARLQQLAESAIAIDPSSAVWQEISRALLGAPDLKALQQVIARVSAEALRGTIGRTPLSAEITDVERAFRTERR